MKIAVAIRLLNNNLDLQTWTIEEMKKAARETDCRLLFYPTNKKRFKEFCEAGAINGEDFTTSQSELLRDASALYVRNIGNKGAKVFSLAKTAIDMGIPVYDPCVEAAVNNGNIPAPNTKMEMFRILTDAGVRTPHTEHYSWNEFLDLQEDQIYGKVVKLNRGGRRGLGTYMMRRLANKDKLQMVRDDLTNNHEISIDGGVLVQEWVKAIGGDWRLMVVNGDVVGCFRRGKRKSTFQATSSKGKSVPVPIDSIPVDLKEMCALAAQATALSICSIDAISVVGGGHCIIEVNEAPSFKAFTKKTGVNPMSILFDGIKRYVEQR